MIAEMTTGPNCDVSPYAPALPICSNLLVLQDMTGHEVSFIPPAAFQMLLIKVPMMFALIFFADLATWLPESIRQSVTG